MNMCDVSQYEGDVDQICKDIKEQEDKPDLIVLPHRLDDSGWSSKVWTNFNQRLYEFELLGVVCGSGRKAVSDYYMWLRNQGCRNYYFYDRHGARKAIIWMHWTRKLDDTAIHWLEPGDQFKYQLEGIPGKWEWLTLS
jgi:hypothetical protein